MKTLSESLNMSAVEDHYTSVGIDPFADNDYAKIIRDYCENNNISLEAYEESDFEAAVEILSDFSGLDNNTFNFWIG